MNNAFKALEAYVRFYWWAERIAPYVAVVAYAVLASLLVWGIARP